MSSSKRDVTIEIIEASPSFCVVINGLRVAGNKPTERIIKTFKASSKDIKEAIGIDSKDECCGCFKYCTNRCPLPEGMEVTVQSCSYRE